MIPIGIGIAGIGLQAFAYLNHDVAWVLSSSDRLLDGGVFGRDIVAVNPPLVWWISAIPMWAARCFGLPPVVAFNLFIMVMVTFSLLACDKLLRGTLTPAFRVTFLGIAALLLTVGSDRDFGQREHLTVILALPYLLLVAARARGENPGTAFTVLIGAAAAVGFAFKPHFLAVPLLTELYLLRKIGIRRTLLRAEFVAAWVVIVLYCIALLTFADAYLFQALPDILQVYWAFNKPDLLTFARKAISPFALLGLVIVLLSARHWPREPLVLAIAAIGFTLAAVLQWKGYSYHLYPVTILSALALTHMARDSEIVRVLTCCVLLLFTALSAISLWKYMPNGIAGRERTSMIDFVNAHTPANGRFLALSTHPFPGFPTALYTRAKWASVSNSRIFLPAVVRLSSNLNENSDLLAFAAAQERKAMLRDMTPPPDLVLVDVKQTRHAIRDVEFNFLRFYLADPDIHSIWKNYQKIDGAPEGYSAYALRKDAAP
jgi:hypothetical protein